MPVYEGKGERRGEMDSLASVSQEISTIPRDAVVRLLKTRPSISVGRLSVRSFAGLYLSVVLFRLPLMASPMLIFMIFQTPAFLLCLQR